MIVECQEKDIIKLLPLAKQVYTNSSSAGLKNEFKELLLEAESKLYLWVEEEDVVGFAQFQLRHDYVEGTSKSPCGYLEGVFVRESYRRRGIAEALVKQGEVWSKEKGCVEFASDCELDNHLSLLFHEKVGFIEISRNIHFVKKIM